MVLSHQSLDSILIIGEARRVVSFPAHPPVAEQPPALGVSTVLLANGQYVYTLVYLGMVR